MLKSPLKTKSHRKLLKIAVESHIFLLSFGHSPSSLSLKLSVQDSLKWSPFLEILGKKIGVTLTAPSAQTKSRKSLCEFNEETSRNAESFDVWMSSLRPTITERNALQKNNFFVLFPRKKGIKFHSRAQTHFSLEFPEKTTTTTAK